MSDMFFWVSVVRPELMLIFGGETFTCPHIYRSLHLYSPGTEHLWPFLGFSHPCWQSKQILHVSVFKWAVRSSLWEAGWWDAGRPGWILWRPDWWSFHWGRLWCHLFSKFLPALWHPPGCLSVVIIHFNRIQHTYPVCNCKKKKKKFLELWSKCLSGSGSWPLSKALWRRLHL